MGGAYFHNVGEQPQELGWEELTNYTLGGVNADLGRRWWGEKPTIRYKMAAGKSGLQAFGYWYGDTQELIYACSQLNQQKYTPRIVYVLSHLYIFDKHTLGILFILDIVQCLLKDLKHLIFFLQGTYLVGHVSTFLPLLQFISRKSWSSEKRESVRWEKYQSCYI